MLDFHMYFNVLGYELIFPNISFCGGSVCSVDYASIHRRWFLSSLCQIVTNFVGSRPILLNIKMWILHPRAVQTRVSDFSQLNHFRTWSSWRYCFPAFFRPRREVSSKQAHFIGSWIYSESILQLPCTHRTGNWCPSQVDSKAPTVYSLSMFLHRSYDLSIFFLCVPPFL